MINIRKYLYNIRTNILLIKGINEGKIVPFDNDFYKKLSNTYIGGLPVSIHIKYFKPTIPPGKCFDRSLYLFFCFDNGLLVRGNDKSLELRYGKNHAYHGWFEMDNYVYEPALNMRFDKDLYYEMYKPSEIKRITKDEYCNTLEGKLIYENYKNTTIDDFKPNGKNRISLLSIIPLAKEMAIRSGNKEFIDDLNKYLSEIEYDEKEIINEFNEDIDEISLNKNFKGVI